MIDFRYSVNFPEQRVSASEKEKPEWYANCIDYVIQLGIACNDRAETEELLSIQHGNVPDEYYKKTLNPYNANNEKYTRFPATMRNLDIMNDIIRRYVSEYYKGVHEFTVGASNPDIVLKKNAKLQQEIMIMAQQAFIQQVQENYKQLVQQAQQSGQDPNSIDPQQAMPDEEQFLADFNQKYIDDESKQGQELLNYIRSNTDDTIIYLSAFFEYATLGECYTYSEIRGETIFKEQVPCLEAYPIPNNQFFVEDHDMFARKMLLSRSQILDMFDNYFDDKDRDFINKYYPETGSQTSNTLLYSQYFETYSDVCSKFNKEERNLFKKQGTRISAVNNNLYEVWHVVWKGEAKRGILTYVDPQTGMPSTRVVEENYKLNKAYGDISIEWTYENQVYEGYRIGNRYNAIYPIKARAIAYQRNGKLPYNGIMEVLPYMGKFSIIKLITPYQIMRNIFAYHREMVIAKNKLLILMLPQSLIESDAEDRIYKMAADGVLLVDDEDDQSGIKMQQVRMLNASLNGYIKDITDLMEATKQEAREMVDMNMQRYGDISQSAGASTTQEAITRSSMGMVILTQMFDEFRKRDYNRDLDFSKLAYIDGLNSAYWNTNTGERRYISLDVNSHVMSDYSTTVKNDSKELDKLQQLKQWAFSAAQNGDLDMAIAAITGDNVSQIKSLVEKFSEIKRQHETEMQQAEQALKQQELEAKLQQIQAQGEQDRLTEQLKYQYEMQLKSMDVDMSLLASPDNTNDKEIERRLNSISEQNKLSMEREKLNLDRQKLQTDLYNKAADREVRREDIRTKLQIAKTNKNKYDK